MSDQGVELELAGMLVGLGETRDDPVLRRRTGTVTAKSGASYTVSIGGVLVASVRSLAPMAVGDVVELVFDGPRPLIVGRVHPTTVESSLDMIDVGSTLAGGTPPVGAHFFSQAGSNVLTIPAGPSYAFLTFPTAFPNGLLTMTVTNGDAGATAAALSLLNTGVTGSDVFAGNLGGGGYAGLLRVNWFAIGW